MAQPPLRDNGRYKVEQHRVGRRLYGGFVQFFDGRKCYVAYRWHKEIYRGGMKSISQAMRMGVAAWAIDQETLYRIEREGVRYIAVMERNSRDFYLAKLEWFFDPDLSEVHNYEGQGGGTLQRRLPLHYFKYRRGKLM